MLGSMSDAAAADGRTVGGAVGRRAACPPLLRGRMIKVSSRRGSNLDNVWLAAGLKCSFLGNSKKTPSLIHSDYTVARPLEEDVS